MRAEAGSHLGVRSRSGEEWRQILRLTGWIWIGNTAVTPLIALGPVGQIRNLAAFYTLAAVAVLTGVGMLVAASVVPSAVIDRIVGPLTLAVFAAAIIVPGVVYYLGDTRGSFQIAIAYELTAVMAFYLLIRPLAFGVTLAAAAAYAVYLLAVGEIGRRWYELAALSVGLLITGYVVGRLIETIDRERTAKETARAALADLNTNLEAKVEAQVEEVARLGRLRRFLSAPVAEAVLTAHDEAALRPHRREIAVLFCDLRGFTSFTKQVEPEEVIAVLDAYYTAAGAQITRFGATLGSFEGDGLMAYLNDPIPCDDPAVRGIELALAVGTAVDGLLPEWRRRGYELSYGIGMALGHATLGVVGFDGRSDYTALGTVVNLSARLCAAAKGREIIVDHRLVVAADGAHPVSEREPATLKGFAEPVRNYLLIRDAPSS